MGNTALTSSANVHNASRWQVLLPAASAGRLHQALVCLELCELRLSRLERLLHALAAQSASAGFDWLESPRAVTALARLTCAAPWLIEQLIKTPQAFDAQALTQPFPGTLCTDPLPSLQQAFQAESRLAPLSSDTAEEAAWSTAIRRWRNRVYLHLTVAALMEEMSTQALCWWCSHTAEHILVRSWGWAFERLCHRHGLPLKANGQLAAGLVVAMGKLGGRELNYLSDIDLIFLHEGDQTPCLAWDAQTHPLNLQPAMKPGEWLDASAAHFWESWQALGQQVSSSSSHAAQASAQAASRRLDSQEFYQHLGRLIIRLIGAPASAEEGIFLVDCDLRPLGGSGLLSPSVTFAESYYENQGREWERAALLRSRCVLGTQELIRAFKEAVRPFVWRRYLDFSAVEGLMLIKQEIDRQGGMHQLEDIKLGRGGIREHEFFIQALQLLNGGRRLGLRTSSHQAAIQALAAEGLLSCEESKTLSKDYWLLREVENRLQMQHGFQAASLPKNKDGWLTTLHNFEPQFSQQLLQAKERLQQARQRTAERFSGLFQPLQVSHNLPNPQAWQERLNPLLADEAGQQLSQRLHNIFSQLMRSREGERCILKLTQLLLMLQITPLNQPDALSVPLGQQTLLHWVELLERIGSRNAIYGLLVSQPRITEWISRLFMDGGWLTQMLKRHPQFLETFLLLSLSWQEILQILRQPSSQEKDQEALLLELHQWKSQALLFVFTAWRDSWVAATPQLHHQMLTELAEKVVRFCLAICRNNSPHHQFCVMALGRLGNHRMHFGSDLDLVYLNAQPGQDTRLAMQLNNLLSFPTQYGSLYALDNRLRPFGSQGQLVHSLEGYINFLQNKSTAGSKIWNYQAFTSMRPIAGEFSLGNTLLHEVAKAWQQFGVTPQQLAASVQEMLAKLTQAHPQGESGKTLQLRYQPGGTTAVEFLEQAWKLYARLNGTPDWTNPAPAEMMASLQEDYTCLNAVSECLSLHNKDTNHLLHRDHWQQIPLLQQPWDFDAVQAASQRIQQGVAQGFAQLAAAKTL